DDGTMTFGEEDAQEVEDDGDDGGDSSSSDSDSSSSGGGSDEGTMTFGEDEGKEVSKSKEEPPLVGFVAVPSDALDGSQRGQLQRKLKEALRNIPDIKLEMGPGVLSALQERTVATCVTEPLCLGSVGEKAGVDRLVLAMVDKGSRGMELEINYFHVKDRLFIKSETVRRLGNFNKVLDEVPSTVKKVFGVRQQRESQEYATQNKSLAKTVIAVGCGVLSAGALTGGIVFGTQAADAESKLNSQLNSGDGEVHNIKQAKAQEMLEDAKGKASTANIFYGLSGAFAVASTVLFIIDPGGDVSEGRRANALERIDIVPSFSRSGAGFSASFDF
ncbi:MAG: hypothetical protein ABEN55_11150, partial [Bradymonadaceae bacterium]